MLKNKKRNNINKKFRFSTFCIDKPKIGCDYDCDSCKGDTRMTILEFINTLEEDKISWGYCRYCGEHEADGCNSDLWHPEGEFMPPPSENEPEEMNLDSLLNLFPEKTEEERFQEMLQNDWMVFE